MRFSDLWKRRDILWGVAIAGLSWKAATRPRAEVCPDPISQPERLNFILEGSLRRPTSAIAYFAKAAFRSQERIMLRDPFHEIIRQAIVKRAAYYNAQVLTFPHGLTGNPAEDAAGKLERFLREPYGPPDLPLKGVILSPVDSYVYTSAMNQAREAKIPVISIDTPLDEVNARLALCHVGSDNKKLGQILAEWGMSVVEPPAEMLLILGPYREINSDARMSGMISTLADKGYAITTIANGDWSGVFGRGVLSWFNRLYPNNEVKLILCANDGMARGAGLYYRNLPPWKKKGKTRPFIGGIDGSKDGKDFIRTGDMDFTIGQNAYEMGEAAVNSLIDFVDEGIEPESFTDVGIGEQISRPL